MNMVDRSHRDCNGGGGGGGGTNGFFIFVAGMRSNDRLGLGHESGLGLGKQTRWLGKQKRRGEENGQCVGHKQTHLHLSVRVSTMMVMMPCSVYLPVNACPMGW